MRFTTLNDWLDWQETLHPKSIDLGLDRIREVYRRLQLKRPAPIVITVAGTNGKGSCVAMLDAILRAGSYRMATYTSPHLLRYNERVTINGAEVSDEQLMEAFQRVDQARGGISLSYFEFGTLAAFDIMERAELDVAVLEVGLGGRLDAVNIIDADCALITTIGLDHTDWLGLDRESIAREKAGIMRAGKPVVIGHRDPPSALMQRAQFIGAHANFLGHEFDYAQEDGEWQWSSELVQRHDLPLPALSGDHQLDNAAACLMVLQSLKHTLPVASSSVAEGLKTVTLPGRAQRFSVQGKEVLLDIAHNPQAARSLAVLLNQMAARRPQVAVFAQLINKDHAGTIEPLKDFIDHWYVAGLKGERGITSQALARAVAATVGRDRCTQCDTVSQAFEMALQALPAESRIVVFGSFYTVGEVTGKLAHYASVRAG